MTEIHHFAYGWINPTLAYVMSFLGSLLGLVLASRARQVNGTARVQWLVLAGIAIGGTGIWLMHFMAMLGFDVPQSSVRYHVPTTIASVVIAVVIVTAGLLVVSFGRWKAIRVVVGGVFTGLGVAAMHYTGMAALRVGGQISYEPRMMVLSIIVAVVASIVALWFAVVISGASATVAAAAVMGVAVCGMHYTAMAAVSVRLDASPAGDAVGPFALVTPISISACLVITALAYATVGMSIRREHQRAELDLPSARRDELTMPISLAQQTVTGRLESNGRHGLAGQAGATGEPVITVRPIPVRSGPGRSGPAHSRYARQR